MNRNLLIILSSVVIIASLVFACYLILNRNIIAEVPSEFFSEIIEEMAELVEYPFEIIKDAKTAVRIAKAVDKSLFEHHSHLGSITYHDAEKNYWLVELKGFFGSSAYFILDGKSGKVLYVLHGKL